MSEKKSPVLQARYHGWRKVRVFEESRRASPLYAAIHFVRSVPILQVVNGVHMLKFDLGAAPTDFSPIPPGRKLRVTQRRPTLLKNADFPQPVVRWSIP